ncbi:hypothetical protein [Micromonospora sp. NBC_01813]|uniref:hypothetical protein n=1 Tax=Micromonospora sp. NBC_01813 TaxID=2975988 RepID=UPI002DD83DF7|nr:hypothetical protein [Micromonospora sp. NBC_01813]WSA08512.1 hypothetical protein OG958_30750 [Micromonospora sp. NBC_01813]
MPAAPPLALTTDLSTSYPEHVELRAALDKADWAAASELITGQPPGAGTDLIWYASTVDTAHEVARRQHDTDPSDGTAAALLGACLIKQAWAVRTRARAEFVSQEQFREFFRILRIAERVLIDATAYHPDNCAAWSYRLVTARGLELGQAEIRRRYDRLAEIDPHHLAGQRQLLQQLCPKWGGSFEQMLAFARQAVAAAPPGALNGRLLAEAHAEQWLELKGSALRDFRKDPQVRQELRDAAARSVLHPAATRAYGWVEAHNAFAMIFSVIGDHAGAAPHFAAVGNVIAADAWAYVNNPVASFGRFRKLATKAAGEAR